MKRTYQVVMLAAILPLAFSACSSTPRSEAPQSEGTPNLNTTIIGDDTLSPSGSSKAKGNTTVSGDETH
jgi:hypothetical protein